ncbi:MAG: transcription termination/antitermination protein NusA [Candidatus Sumerlaeia bacterium]|nr:transcription termination/antitermination protein NusA [Candidatus Sumerlaeia bacterium]
MAKKKNVNAPEILNLKNFIKQIAKEKDLEMDMIKEAVESAISSAAQKRSKAFTDAKPVLDLETGELRIYVKKKVVISVTDDKHEIDILTAKAQNPKYMLGQEVEVGISPEEFGRIAAQSVRQGILQRLRDAERDRVHEDWKDKVGQVVTVIVQRPEREGCIVNLGRVECLLPRNEMPMGVKYRNGDRLRCLIVDVRRPAKGPQIILSRNRSELVKQLFATEVSEIHDGTVRIMEIAREPGVRTKVAVHSTDTNVDPVGACVGLKGQRVQAIVRELNNEKIDIVPYSPIPENFIKSALNPAQIISINLHPVEKRAEVVVERESLSKAIGKRGQNAKLAARLTGWKIDISEQEEAETMARIEQINLRYLEDFLTQIEGLSEFMREVLAKSKFNSVEKLADADTEDLAVYTHDRTELAEEIISSAQEYLEGLEELTSTNDDSEMSEDSRKTLKSAEDLANRLAGKTVSFDPEPPAETPESETPATPEEAPQPEE